MCRDGACGERNGEPSASEGNVAALEHSRAAQDRTAYHQDATVSEDLGLNAPLEEPAARCAGQARLRGSRQVEEPRAVIVTVKLLGLRARDAGTVVKAARRIVAYVEGAPAAEPTKMRAAYYGENGQSRGRARGSGGSLVGLRGPVSSEQLQQLLTGRHAATGSPLLTGTGSAGRVDRGTVNLPAGQRWFTLTEAARIVGVDASYLRRLARQSSGAETGGPQRQRDAEPSEDAAPSTSREEQHDDSPGEKTAARLAAERDPDSGRWRVARDELIRFVEQREPPTVVIGFDVVCAVPKSLSLLWVFGDDELRRDIENSMNAAVDAVFTYLERHAAQGMVGSRNHPGLGLAAASYLHDVSRADEAHLHIHNIVANAVAIPVLDETGRPERDPVGGARVEWRALDSELFLAHARTAGFVGAAVLRHELARRRGVTWAPVRNGVAELEDFPTELLAAFSTRHGQVQEELGQLVAQGMLSDGRTEAAAQRRSRAAKKVLADAEVHAVQERRLTEAGWHPSQVRDLARRRDRVPVQPTAVDLAELADRLMGPQGLTAKAPTFDRRDVYREVAAWACDRLDAHAISTVVDQLLADPRIVRFEQHSARRRHRGEETFSTEDLLDTEDSLLSLCRQGRVDRGGPPRTLIPPAAVEAALSGDGDGALGGIPGVRLSGEQQDLVRRLLTDDDLVRLVVGPAGSGKTAAMRTVARVLAARGVTVLGAAHGGRQAEQLAATLEVETRVVSGWLTLLDHTEDPASYWPDDTVLIVDEASQVSTRDAERFLRYATRTGTVVILVGDPAQLGSVGAGGWFAHLVTETTPPQLTGTHRQRGPGMAEVRAALAGLRSALPAEAMAAVSSLARSGHVRLFDDRAALLSTAVSDWYTERRQAGRATPMMAEHQRDVDALNTAARDALTADGTLTGPVLTAAGREYQTGDEVITLTQAGHTLIPAGRPRGDYIRTGTIGRIVAVRIDPSRPQHQSVTVRFPGKGTVDVGWDYLTHPFPDGRDGGLGHAYALTAHKAQGSTMSTARPLIVDDTSRPGLYVMLSRAQQRLQAYLIRRPDLEADLDDEDWLPVLPIDSAVDRLAERLRTSRAERLAGDLDPIAQTAHRLGSSHSLAELLALDSPTGPRGSETERPGATVLRRAQIAAQARVTAAAVAAPEPALLARIGPRPEAGPHRLLWDRAVSALATYRAAHAPAAPADDPGPRPEPGHQDTGAQRWKRLRGQATMLADAWATRLSAGAARRFATGEEAVPRRRSVAGIHALLDAGWDARDLLAKLGEQEQTTARTGASVLDHRVAVLCARARLDIAAFQLPAPQTAAEAWHAATTLLGSAESRYLATRPTADLAAEERLLGRVLRMTRNDDELRAHLLTRIRRMEADHSAAIRRLDHDNGPSGVAAAEGSGPSAQTPPAVHRLRRAQAAHELRLRRTLLAAVDGDPAAHEVAARHQNRVNAALEHQIDEALLRIDQEPPRYLTDLMGSRPADAAGAARWRERARAVEDFRHRELGLAYGVLAAPSARTPSARALDVPPKQPELRVRYQALLSDPQQLDIDL
ncbi:TrwC relaxase [Parafrankia sp. EAN1pec]|nr:TrwC relaxase [Frankia sp. EAN1pec]